MNLPSLFSELRRRHVFRVAGLYAVLAWVLIQVTTAVFPHLALPDWSITLVIVLLALGFPVAVVLAWALELTPSGVQRTPTLSGADVGAALLQSPPPEPLGQNGVRAPIHVAPADAAPGPASIAVLPFANLSTEAENEHFSDGLTEEIISDLSAVHALRVTSRTSVMVYKGTRKDARAIGRELGVRYLLEGSVRRAGTSLRITAQLIDSETDAHLWADKLTGELDDVFAFQERISRRIVEALRARLTPEEDRRLAARSFRDVQVLDLYLRARQEMWGFNPESLARAEALIRDGLARERDNALLLSVLGTVHALRIVFRLSSDLTELDRAEQCAARAAAADPDLPQLHVLRGVIAYGRINFQESALHFVRALDIAPSNPDALLWLGFHLAWTGRFARARAIAGRLRVVDPLSSQNLNLYGYIELLDGEMDEAARIYREWVTREPGAGFGWIVLAHALAYADRPAEAIAVAAEAQPHCEGVPVLIPLLQLLVAALAGDREGARSLLETEGLKNWEVDETAGLLVAGPLALLDEAEIAMEWLRRSMDNGFLAYAFLLHDPFLAPLRSRPDFQALIAEMKQRSDVFRI